MGYPTPVTQKHWMAVGVVGSGLVAMTTIALFASGKKAEGLTLALISGLLGTTFAAARVLNEDGASSAKPPVTLDPASLL